MASEPRVWADIDRTWLQDYLKKHDLASEFDLDDVLIGSQVSWILGANEWAKLRDAWREEQQGTGIVTDRVQAPAAEELPATTETLLESADAGLIEEDEQAAQAGSEAPEKNRRRRPGAKRRRKPRSRPPSWASRRRRLTIGQRNPNECRSWRRKR